MARRLYPSSARRAGSPLPGGMICLSAMNSDPAVCAVAAHDARDFTPANRESQASEWQKGPAVGFVSSSVAFHQLLECGRDVDHSEVWKLKTKGSVGTADFAR